MKFITRFKNWMVQDYLIRKPPEKIIRAGEKITLSVFKDVAAKVPAYGQFLKDHGVAAEKIKNISDFKHNIPVTNKEIFEKFSIEELSRKDMLKDVTNITTSSGFSKKFSYAVFTAKELEHTTRAIDGVLDIFFDVTRKKTLWISGLSSGVKVYTSAATLAETSVKSESIIAIVKQMASQFEQIIITGNTFFIKKVIEDGIDAGIDWKSLPVHFTLGEDWFPENYRDYLAHLTGIDLDRISEPGSRLICSTMGISEVGLVLFLESRKTIAIKRLCSRDAGLRKEIAGEETDVIPSLFLWIPLLLYLEEVNGELVFTPLNRERVIPLIRYASGDRGRILTYQELKQALEKFGYHDYVPLTKLPCVVLSGRSGKSVIIKGNAFTPEQVKTGIYSDFDAAFATTGYFHMSEKNGRLLIEVQLRPGRKPTDELFKKFRDAIARYVKTDFELVPCSYEDFPYGQGLIYEQKFQYI